MKKHDFQIGWFYAIAGRHREAAPEVQYIFEVNRKFRQLDLFPNDDMRPDVGNAGATIAQRVADEINAGALNKDGMTVTASTSSGKSFKQEVKEFLNDAGLKEGVHYETDVPVK